MDIVLSYHEMLAAIDGRLGGSPALVKLHAGMAIYLGCLLLMGTRRGSLAAVLAALGLALVHEAMNRLHLGVWNWHETARDLVLVSFWPTACYAVSWYRRWNWSERERQRANDRLLHLYDYRPLRDDPVEPGPAGSVPR